MYSVAGLIITMVKNTLVCSVHLNSNKVMNQTLGIQALSHYSQSSWPG